jgi:hypothetical protein
MTELALAQTLMDEATNATLIAQDNMTSSAGNMTDTNMTLIGQLEKCL